MTLHPWPLNDSSTRDGAAVLWTGSHGLGLMTDSLAVPLRFPPDEPIAAAVAAAPAVSAVKPALHSAAFDPSALLRLRDISCRFGTGA